jgi:hypothetical protein
MVDDDLGKLLVAVLGFPFPMVLHDGLVSKFDLGGFCFRL